MSARERMKSNHEEGLCYKERLKKIKFTTDHFFKAKECRVSKDIIDIFNENNATAEKE